MNTRSDPFHELAHTVAGAYTPGRALLMGICAVAGFVAVVNSSWIATPDSALYLELGESLAQGRGYVFNGESHTYVPPGFPFLVARVVGEFGKDFLAYRVLMGLLGIGAAVLAVLLVVRLYGRDLGLLVGGLCAVNHVLLENSTLTTSDVPFGLVVFAGLHAMVTAGAGERVSRPWVLVAGLLIGMAPLFRVNGWGVPPAAALYLLTRPWDSRWGTRVFWVAAFLVISVIPAALWDLWRSSQPASFSEGSYYQAVSGRSLWNQLWVMADALWNYVPETSYAVTGVAVKDVLLEFVVPVLTAIGWVSAVRRGEALWAPLIAVQYAGLLLSSAGSRYLIPLMPGLYLFFALGLLEFFKWISSRLREPVPSGPIAGQLLVGAFVVLAVLNVGHNVKTVLQSRYALEPNGAERLRDLPFFEAGRWLNEHDPRAVVMTMHPRVLHYLSGAPTVELIRSGVPESRVWVNSPELVASLVRERQPAYLFSDSKVEPFFRGVMTGVKDAGLRCEEIPLKGSDDRFRLWRLVHEPAKG